MVTMTSSRQIVFRVVILSNVASFFFGIYFHYFTNMLQFYPTLTITRQLSGFDDDTNSDTPSSLAVVVDDANDFAQSNFLRGGPQVVPSVSDGSSKASSGANIASDELPVPTKVKFTQPSPYLWEDVPIIPPNTDRKKVLVTGAAGFIGSHVAYALLERGDDVVVVDEVNDYYDVRIKRANLDLLREKAKSMDTAEASSDKIGNRLVIYEGDVNNSTLMEEMFEREQPRWICHLAARAGVRPSIKDPLLYVKSNVQATENILEYSRIHQIKNVVIASSSSVYGESESTFFSEAEDVNQPVSPYAATKRSGELLSYTHHHLYGLNITNLRFFTVYGPRGRPDMAPYKFISRVTRGEEIEQFGDGTTSRDYTFIDDIVNGVVRAIDRPYPYQIFNLGKGLGTKLNEFISLVEKHVGKKANIKYMPPQPGDVPFTNADVSKANRLLGYESKVTMEEGIKRTVAWFKETFGEDGMGSMETVNKDRRWR